MLTTSRILRRAVLSGGAALLARPSTSRAAIPRVLKLGCGLGTASTLGSGSLAFAREVARLSEGGLKIDLFLDGALGGEQEIFDAVRTGQIDFAVTTSVGITGPVPALAVFDIPFLFNDLRHARAVMDSPLGQPYLAAAEPLGVTSLAWVENGMRHLTNSRRPIRTPDDLKGLKLRVPQSVVMVKGFNAMGAQTQGMALPLLYGALEIGALDGQETPSPRSYRRGFSWCRNISPAARMSIRRVCCWRQWTGSPPSARRISRCCGKPRWSRPLRPARPMTPVIATAWWCCARPAWTSSSRSIGHLSWPPCGRPTTNMIACTARRRSIGCAHEPACHPHPRLRRLLRRIGAAAGLGGDGLAGQQHG
jgi:hypothetical protein